MRRRRGARGGRRSGPAAAPLLTPGPAAPQPSERVQAPGGEPHPELRAGLGAAGGPPQEALSVSPAHAPELVEAWSIFIRSWP